MFYFSFPYLLEMSKWSFKFILYIGFHRIKDSNLKLLSNASFLALVPITFRISCFLPDFAIAVVIYSSEKVDFARDLWFWMKLILFALNHVVCITWQIEITFFTPIQP